MGSEMEMDMRKRLDIRLYGATAALVALLAAPSMAKDFYEGKTVTIVVGHSAGGGYDTNARLLGRHIGRHLPGSPSIVVQNMPGASGMRSVNHLYATAPRDGTVFGSFHPASPLQEALGNKAVRYKSTELSWIGSLSQSINVLAVTPAAGVRELQDATKKQVIMGAVGGGKGTMGAYPRLINYLFGTKFRIVPGYKGSRDVLLAMERNEVHGATDAWVSWKINRPDWVAEGKIVVLAQIGPEKVAELQDVPLLHDLAKTDEQRQMIDIFSRTMQIERPFAGPPGIPADRLSILRRAFDRTVKDAQFLADAKRSRAEINPHTGEQVAEAVAAIIGTPPSVVEKVKEATEMR